MRGLANPVTGCHYKQSFGLRGCNEIKFNNDLRLHPKVPGGHIQYSSVKNYSSNKKQPVLCSVGRSDHYQLSYERDLPPQPFWLTLIKEAIWAMKSLLLFLVEQPSQLKYIEWPSFQSTLKTATLTLVIVALLIVALSSVDALLCYVLALLLRRTA